MYSTPSRNDFTHLTVTSSDFCCPSLNHPLSPFRRSGQKSLGPKIKIGWWKKDTPELEMWMGETQKQRRYSCLYTSMTLQFIIRTLKDGESTRGSHNWPRPRTVQSVLGHLVSSGPYPPFYRVGHTLFSVLFVHTPSSPMWNRLKGQNESWLEWMEVHLLPFLLNGTFYKTTRIQRFYLSKQSELNTSDKNFRSVETRIYGHRNLSTVKPTRSVRKVVNRQIGRIT